MNKLITITSLLICFAFLGINFSYADKHESLSYITEEYPPWNFEENGTIKGIGPDLMRLMWKKMGYPEQEIKLLPWVRAYNLIQKNNNYVLMTMTRTANREKLFKWVGPMSNTRYSFIGLAKNSFKINTLDDAQNYIIGTLKEDAGEQIIIESGFDRKNIVSLTSIDQLTKMLKHKRIDFLIYDERGYKNYLKSKNYNVNEFKTFFVLKDVDDYFAFNKNIDDSLVNQFQQALNSLEEEHKAILKHYLNDN